MKNWTSNGHLSELGLELCAAEEAPQDELRVMRAHLHDCPACQALEGEVRALFAALASLRQVEPSPSFDARVLTRVRAPAGARAAAAPGGRPTTLRRLRPILLGAAAAWAAVVAGGAAWLVSRVDIPASVVVASVASGARDLLIAAAIEVGTFLHLSGAADLWARLSETVPGPELAAAVAMMTALSGLAIWTLHRVTGEPSRVEAHA